MGLIGGRAQTVLSSWNITIFASLIYPEQALIDSALARALARPGLFGRTTLLAPTESDRGRQHSESRYWAREHAQLEASGT